MFKYYKIKIDDTKSIRIPISAFYVIGTLVKVNDLSAYLRLYKEPIENDKSEIEMLPIPDKKIPDLSGIWKPYRKLKWIVALDSENNDKAVVYWKETIVTNWLNTGLTAEFKWQPSSESISEIPMENLVSHFEWSQPFYKKLGKYIDMEKTTDDAVKKIHMSDTYEENWNWDSDSEEYEEYEKDKKRQRILGVERRMEEIHKIMHPLRVEMEQLRREYGPDVEELKKTSIKKRRIM